MASKTELLGFLDKHVFDAILHAREGKGGGKAGEDLAEVQRKTVSEKERFHGYDTAERIVAMYKDDLHSEKARPVNARLKELGLPRLVDVKEKFLKMAGEG